MNHIVWIVLDSARYDTFAAASTPNLDRVARAERRWSYASWTVPSHHAYLVGLTPHHNRPGRSAASEYRRDLGRWPERVGRRVLAPADPGTFLPELSVPRFLGKLGYRSEAYVSLPVLNPSTLVAGYFDHFELMPAHNDLAAILKRVEFGAEPRFYFINTGETHYPYLLPGEDGSTFPRLSGVHGTFRHLGDFLAHPHDRDEDGTEAFGAVTLRAFWEKQVACIEHLDRVVGTLLDRAPRNLWLMVTSDHGEMFGEDGFFGHGPVMHEKVFEVFFLEGLAP
ncbi:MAG TPA: sulfatase-like hydrolase/transferase [Longimicrobiaceae bacterium]